jgi:hypothetical protein
MELTAWIMLDSNYPLHLDSYLAWIRVNEEKEKGVINPWPADDNLPLAKDKAYRSRTEKRSRAFILLISTLSVDPLG